MRVMKGKDDGNLDFSLSNGSVAVGGGTRFILVHAPARPTCPLRPCLIPPVLSILSLRGFRTEVIGQGAYGVVYRGNQITTGNQVAIKRIPFADATPEGGVPCNVIREISLLRELDHDNVVKLLDVIQAAPGGLYLVFEYVAHDLKSFMDQYQTSDDINERVGLPASMVRSFMRQILQGVGFCHTYRVLHRDLKPHNVSPRPTGA